MRRGHLHPRRVVGEGDARGRRARGVRLRVGKARVVIEGEVDELDVHADEIGELEDLVHRAVDGDVALLHLHLRLGDFAPARLLLAVGQGGVQVRHHRGLDLGEGHVAGEGHLEPRAPVVQTKGVVRGVRGLAALRLGARVLESHVESPTLRNTRRRGGGDAPRRGRRRRVRDEIHRRGRRGRLLHPGGFHRTPGAGACVGDFHDSSHFWEPRLSCARVTRPRARIR